MRKPSPAMIVALAALFVALGGVGIAANGQSLILGKPDNSATLKTGLSAPINDKALQLTNTSTGTSATALGLTVASGRPPLVVDSTAGKATNLNADKLDGIDSSGLVQGKGHYYSKRATAGIGTSEFLLLALPGIGNLYAHCIDFDADNAGDPSMHLDFVAAASIWWQSYRGRATNLVWAETSNSTEYDFSENPESDHLLATMPGGKMVDAWFVQNGYTYGSGEGGACDFAASATVS
jgi:hypothetical protein